jgi:hypothetical protein
LLLIAVEAAVGVVPPVVKELSPPFGVAHHNAAAVDQRGATSVFCNVKGGNQ